MSDTLPTTQALVAALLGQLNLSLDLAAEIRELRLALTRVAYGDQEAARSILNDQGRSDTTSADMRAALNNLKTLLSDHVG